MTASGGLDGVSVTSVCQHLGMSRQNYYARRQERQKQAVDAELITELVQAERRVQPRLGARKLLVVLAGPLAKAGVKVGRDRFLRSCGGAGCCWSGCLGTRRRPPVPIIACRCLQTWSKGGR